MASHSARFWYTFTTLLVLTRSAFGISDHRKLLRRDASTKVTEVEVPSFYFSMPVDHFNSDDTRTYLNRYFMNDTYYRQGGPVFFYDFGETTVTAGDASAYLAESYGASAMMQLAQHYGGLVIGWEHRYYGYSQPFPETIINDTALVNGTRDTWQYLTQEQALEDVVYFATHFAPEGYDSNYTAALHPSQTPWIWIGGSYPASRGAWIRIRNPEIIYAVWSSSAPVQARVDGSPYFTPIEASLPANCSTDVKAVVKYIDQIMSNKNSTAYSQLQSLVYVASETSTQRGFNVSLSMSQALKYDEGSIGNYFAQALWTDFQYGGPSRTTRHFCDFMQSYNPMTYKATPDNDLATVLSILQNPGNMTFNSEGIAKHYGVNAAVQAYIYAARRYIASMQTGGTSNTLDDQAWAYQYLTEFGWLQGSNPDDITIISKYDNYTYQQESTTALYFNTDPSIIPSEPNVNHTLTKYGGWEMSPSNVMFTNGEDDPWRTFSVMSQEQDLGAPLRNIVQTVPRCNQSPQGTDVFGLLYPGQVHVSDFTESSGSGNPATSPYVAGLTLFSQALDVWLPCFQAKSG